MKIVGMVLLVLAVVCIVIGGVFIQQSFTVKAQLLDAIKAQRITSGGVQEEFVLDEDKLNNPEVTVIPPTGTATAPVTKTVWAITTTVPPTGTATAPVPTTIVAPYLPGEIVELEDKIEGIIDTPKEVKLMADTLLAHLLNGYPPYGSIDRNDRGTFLDGLNMITSLNLAQMGFGVCTIALGAGVFMVVTGLGFGITGTYLWRRKTSNP